MIKSIGILFDLHNKEQIDQMKPLVDYFFGLKKDVKAFGHVNSKKYGRMSYPKVTV